MRVLLAVSLACLLGTQTGCITAIISDAIELTRRCAVESEPPGASINLNGKHIGEAPCQVPYPLGEVGRDKFYFTARRDGYRADMKSYNEFPAHVLFELKRAPDEERITSATRRMLECNLAELPPVPERSSVAVLDFQVGEDVSRSVGEALADYCREMLQASQRFILVDRQHMRALLTEEDFDATFTCDDTRCLVDFGRKLRAQKIIHGRTSEVGEVYVLTLTMVDVGSARIEAIRNAKVFGTVEELLDFVGPATCELLHDALPGARPPSEELTEPAQPDES